MFKNNKKDVKMVKIKIVYDNFVNKYTKQLYKLGDLEVTEKRMNEMLELEKSTGVKLIEIIDKEYLSNNSNDDESFSDSEEKLVSSSENSQKDDNSSNSDNDDKPNSDSENENTDKK